MQKLTGEVSTIDEVDMCMSDGDDEDMNDDIDTGSSAATAAETDADADAAAGSGGAQSAHGDGSAAAETVGFGGSLAAVRESEKAARWVWVCEVLFVVFFVLCVQSFAGSVALFCTVRGDTIQYCRFVL